LSLVTFMGRVPAAANPDGGLVRVMAGGRLIGLGVLEGGMLRPERVLTEAEHEQRPPRGHG
jgi:tRNA pseudouridine55 synthase